MHINLNNLPEEPVTMKGKWLALYTVGIIAATLTAGSVLLASRPPVIVESVLAPQPPVTLQQKPRQLLADVKNEWTYPGFQYGGTGSSATTMQFNGTVGAPVKTVWEFYARKCGYTSEYKANLQAGLGNDQGQSQITSIEDRHGGLFTNFNFYDNAYLVNVSLVQTTGQPCRLNVFINQLPGK